MISNISGNNSLNKSPFHFSKASAKIVWLVYANTLFATLKASSNSNPSSFINILISSGIAIVG